MGKKENLQSSFLSSDIAGLNPFIFSKFFTKKEEVFSQHKTSDQMFLFLEKAFWNTADTSFQSRLLSFFLFWSKKSIPGILEIQFAN